MKKILSAIVILCMSVCIFSCSDSEEENIIDNFSVSEVSEEKNITESVPVDTFAKIGYGKANEIAVILDGDGVELPVNCIYSTDTLKNFNISDELYQRLGSELAKYTEMKTDHDYFLVIQNYICTCFVCTDGTETGIMNTSGIAAEGSYDEIYQSIYNEISVQ